MAELRNHNTTDEPERAPSPWPRQWWADHLAKILRAAGDPEPTLTEAERILAEALAPSPVRHHDTPATQQLTVSHWGPWPQREVVLADFTLVLGPESSGKTALCNALVAAHLPDTNSAELDTELRRADLRRRYGPMASAKITAAPRASDGLLAWRIPLDGRPQGLGECGTRELLRELARAMSLAPLLESLDLAGRREALRQLSAELAEEQGRLREARQAWADRFAQGTELEARAEAVARDIEKVRGEEAQAAARVQQAQRALQELEEARGRAHQRAQLLGKIQARRDQRRDLKLLADLQPYSACSLEQLDALLEDLAEHQRRLAAIDAQIDAVQRRREQIAEEQRAVEQERERRRRGALKAAAMLRLLGEEPAAVAEPGGAELVAAQAEALSPGPERTLVRSAGWVVALTAAGLALAGDGASVMLGSGVGVGLGVLSLFGSRRHEQVHGDSVGDLAVLCERWNSDPELPPLQVRDREGICTFLRDQISAYEAWEQRERSTPDKERTEQDMSQLMVRSRQMLEDTLPTRQDAIRHWLEQHRVDDREAYVTLLERKRAVVAQIETRCAVGVPADIPGCQREEEQLEGEVKALPVESVPSQDDREGARQAVRDAQASLQDCGERRQQLLASLESLRQQREALAAETTPQEAASLQAALGELAARWEALESETHAVERLEALLTGEGWSTERTWQVLTEEVNRALEDAGAKVEPVVVRGFDLQHVWQAQGDTHHRQLALCPRGQRRLVILALWVTTGVWLGGCSSRAWWVLDDLEADLSPEQLTVAAALLAQAHRRGMGPLLVCTSRPEVGELLPEAHQAPLS